MDLQIIICFVMIFLLGVPHGALDPSIAKHRLGVKDVLPKSLFYASYITMAILVFTLWLNLPILSLAMFLFVSCLHFGREREQDCSHGGLPFGFLVIGLPALFNFDAVVSIFSTITFNSTDNQIIEWMTYIIVLFGIVGFFQYVQTVMRKRRFNLYGELLFILSFAFLSDPLVYFTFYFCFIHSAKHIIGEFRSLPIQYRKESLINVFFIMLGTSILTIWGYQSNELLEMQSDRLLFLIFAGLAALTYPHMMLMETVRFRRKRLELI